MALKTPQSLKECVYFTNRTLDNGGSIVAWVYRKQCPQCKNAQMGKPVEKGKVRTRATNYECPSCHFSEEKKEHEESLQLEAQYTCPKCGKEGESSAPYQRKNFKKVQAFVVECQYCNMIMPLTKKLKELK